MKEKKPVKVDKMVSLDKALKQDSHNNSFIGLAIKSFSATENTVRVYHKDGTMAQYRLFKDSGI